MSGPFEEQYFKANYGSDYDRRNPERKLRFYLSQVLRLRRHGRLLDVGCAYGNFLVLARRHFDASGLDLSAHAVEIARSRLPGATVTQGGVLEIGVTGQFEVITCFDTLEHVARLDQALTVLREALVPGGVLVITVPVYDTMVGRIVRILDHDPTHLWKESRAFWEVRMEECGFELVRKVGLWRYSLFGSLYLFTGASWLYPSSPAVLLIGSRA